MLSADLVSAFPAGQNAAATWSTRLMKNRGQAMGAEHGGKGVDVQLGPVAGPIGRTPEGGRNWEGNTACSSWCLRRNANLEQASVPTPS